MAATPKKGVLVPVNDERKHGAAAPAALAQKLASPAKAASKEALRERMEAAAVRRDIELEQRQFRAHNSAIPKGEVAAPGASKASLEAKLAKAEARRLVGAHALGRLVGQLDGRLQHSDRNHLLGQCAEEDAEARVCAHREGLELLLELG